MKPYKLVNNYPVARFYYKGHHSHPIRRTVLVTESNDKFIRGYEVRDGDTVRNPSDAPIKTFLRRKIARIKSMRPSIKKDVLLVVRGPDTTTLQRSLLYDYLFTGP